MYLIILIIVVIMAALVVWLCYEEGFLWFIFI